jgi:hypothetical protein
LKLGNHCGVNWLSLCVALAFAACTMGAQTTHAKLPQGDLPMPDPGYSLYYHESLSEPDTAARWGYHDGWTDGRHDRNHGSVEKAADKSQYHTAPDHGTHGVARETYIRIYREAYTHGYERGSRR